MIKERTACRRGHDIIHTHRYGPKNRAVCRICYNKSRQQWRRKNGSKPHASLKGQRFGRWSVLRRAGSNKAKKSTWLCRCDCGAERIIARRTLRDGTSRSCGCLMRELRTSHGESRSITYRTWIQMMRRCYDPKATGYSRYGARGIIVADCWHSFANFLADMGPRPSSDYSIDRYPNYAGNYEPGNARWATWTEQATNRKTTVRVVFNGEKRTVREWATRTTLVYATLRSRLNKGWTVKESLLTPVGFRRGCGYKENAVLFLLT